MHCKEANDLIYCCVGRPADIFQLDADNRLIVFDIIEDCMLQNMGLPFVASTIRDGLVVYRNLDVTEFGLSVIQTKSGIKKLEVLKRLIVDV